MSSEDGYSLSLLKAQSLTLMAQERGQAQDWSLSTQHTNSLQNRLASVEREVARASKGRKIGMFLRAGKKGQDCFTRRRRKKARNLQCPAQVLSPRINVAGAEAVLTCVQGGSRLSNGAMA